MSAEPLSWIAAPALLLFTALPGLAAWRLRRRSRARSEMAGQLVEYAAAVRRAQRSLELDATLRRRLQCSGLPETLCLQVAQELPRLEPALSAEVAQRLALRLKRRVAFERKMLARTAPGRWRGAVAATLPAAVTLCLLVAGDPPPPALLMLVLTLEALGCWLLWRVAHVDV
jgi:hypothetical protein